MYRKIPKISLIRAYIFFKAPFEGIIFGGACLWREICVSKPIGLKPYAWKEIYRFLLCFTLYLRASSKYKPLAGAVSNRLLPLGSLYLKGRFNRQFFALRVWGTYIWSRLIHGGAYSWNFTVFLKMFSV